MATACYILSVWFILNAILAAGLYFRPKRKSNSLANQDNSTERNSIVLRFQPDGDQPKRNSRPPAQSPAILRVLLFGLFIR